jgi:hypothetical protein
MKRIFVMALLAVILPTLGLACRKVGESSSNQNAGASNSNRKTDDANAKASPASSSQDDNAQLLSDLIDTVHRFNTARNTGDTATQELLLANEFTAQSDGRTYTKADWIDPKGVANFASHKVENAEILSHTQFTASLGYDGKNIYNDGSAPNTVRYTVTLVRRDGRWQIKSVA